VQIVVCVKQVVDTEADKRLSPGDMRIDRSVEAILNPYDEYAVEAGIQLKEQQGGGVTVLCMGPENADEAVRKALAMGADNGVIVSDGSLAGSDTQGTAMRSLRH
jgi:electron transfer flavoprotein beta subunit